MRDRVESASVLCVVLLCFDGAKRAAQIRRPLSKQLEQHGGAVLDAAIIRVDGEGKARVYDPQRTVAGLLTAALTWGVFGLLTSGLIGPIGWAVIGAVCGGLFAYYREQPLSGTQLRRIGEGLRRDSSAIVVFLKGGADQAVLSTAAAYEPTTAGLVEISAELSARVLAGAGGPTEVSTALPGGQLPAADTSTDKSTDKGALLTMLLVRLAGQRGVRQALAELAPAKTPDPSLPQVKHIKVVLESDPRGGVHAHSPNFGVRFSARSSLVSWVCWGSSWERSAASPVVAGSWASSGAAWSPASCGAPSASSPGRVTEPEGQPWFAEAALNEMRLLRAGAVVVPSAVRRAVQGQRLHH